MKPSRTLWVEPQGSGLSGDPKSRLPFSRIRVWGLDHIMGALPVMGVRASFVTERPLHQLAESRPGILLLHPASSARSHGLERGRPGVGPAWESPWQHRAGFPSRSLPLVASSVENPCAFLQRWHERVAADGGPTPGTPLPLSALASHLPASICHLLFAATLPTHTAPLFLPVSLSFLDTWM